MSLITVLGGSGFIGSHLVARLQQLGFECYAPRRDEQILGLNLGVVIYCIGLTSDFRSRPFDTVNAHVCKLLEVLSRGELESLIYLSSTRLYGSSPVPANEADAISINPLDSSDLYNISKALGESLTLAAKQKNTIVRLSNVYGADCGSQNFLSQILREALQNKKIVLGTALDSEKDYVSVHDVVDLLIRLAKGSREQLYNVASGANHSHEVLTSRISELTGCSIAVAPSAPRISYPEININRIRKEFGFTPSKVLDDLEGLINVYRDNKESA